MKKRIIFTTTLAFFALCVSACNPTATSSPSLSGSNSQSGEVTTSSTSKKTSSSSSNSKSNQSILSSEATSKPASSSSSSSSAHSSSNSSNASSSSSSSSSSNPNRPDNVTLDIFAFNDTHGNVKDTQDKGVGISKTTTFIKQQTQNKNALLISQGDMWQGSVESNYTRGNLVTEWMNQLDFVSMTVGNHEYDWGSQPIIDNQQLANFPTLGINVLKRSNSQRVDYLQPSVTVEKAGAKIGIIGAVGNCYNSISSSKVKDIYFAYGDILTNLVKQEANRLRNVEKCDFIIYSLHGAGDRGENDSYDISLSNDHYVDLVLEGHTHQGYAYKDDAGIYHVQNWGYNESIYQVTVNLDLKNKSFNVQPTYHDTSYSSSLRNLEEDAETEALFTKYYDKFSFAYEDLGTIDGFKDPNTLRDKVAELYLENGLTKWGNQYNIILGGGYMSCRGSGLQQGTVRYSDLNNLFPFDNEIELCSVKGSDLRNTQFITGANTYFCSWTDYGNSIRYNIDDNTTYYLVADTYGSDYAYNHLTVIDVLEPGIYARDLLARFIQNGGWAYVPPSNEHAGTVDDPKTIAEALDYARHHSGSNATEAGSEWFFYKGVVTRQAYQLSTLSGDLNNVYVADSRNSEDMQIYYLKRDQYRQTKWASVEDLQIGDTIVFCGQAFYFNNRYLEFASGTYCVSINGVPTV